MRKLQLLLIATLLGPLASFSQAYFYGPDGQITLDTSLRHLLVTFAKGTSTPQKKSILTKEELIPHYSSYVDLPQPNLSLIPLDKTCTKKDHRLLLKGLVKHPNIISAEPLYRYGDGTLQSPTGYVHARAKTLKYKKQILELAKVYKAVLLTKASPDPHVFTFQLPTPVAIAFANSLFETTWFVYAEPDFLRLLQPMHTTDPLLPEQWALHNDGENTSAYGELARADMNVLAAWEATAGSPAIKIAVLDEGVDLRHPDLADNLLPGYDATGQGSWGAAAPSDAHGTACAGIIAALGNNAIGIAGIAYESKVIPIRIAYRAGTHWITTNGWIADAINWAWEQGQADILSNSWGGGSPSSLINEAIDNALRFGRRGLGSPVVFAAGNNNGPLSYPASYSPTIAVTALSMCHERKSLSSCDGEDWWGANYGIGVDVAAPGVKISTLDNSSTDGWSTGDYLSNFNGTSAACPNTAGVLALILSLSPDLSAEEARFILENSCDKVGPYEYLEFQANQSAGTWSQELGYGSINAGKAIASLACEDCLGCIDGQQNGQETGIDCGGPNCLPCPSCADGVRNGDEEAIDCGGSNCEPCDCFDGVLQLTINFDHYPAETSWVIRTTQGITVAEGGPFTEAVGLSTYTQDISLPAGHYVFSIVDSYGDGICCNYGDGSYALIDMNGHDILSGTAFTAAASVAFCTRDAVPSCEDGIQNGSETGIDCGGSCVPCQEQACTSEIMAFTDFETDMGIWQAETLARRMALGQPFSASGRWSMRLIAQENGNGLRSSILDLSTADELELSFASLSTGLQSTREGFLLQLSQDGGKTFTTVAKWIEGVDFDNLKQQQETAQILGPFSKNTVLKFELVGSSRQDQLFLDDILLTVCQQASRPDTAPLHFGASAMKPHHSIPQLFPNPTTGVVYLQMEGGLNPTGWIQIHNLQGKLVHREKIQEDFSKIELARLPAGIYWARISSPRAIEPIKFVIQ